MFKPRRYDAEEGGYGGDAAYGDDSKLKKKEEKLIKQHTEMKKLSEKRRALRHADIEAWEKNRLRTTGMGEREEVDLDGFDPETERMVNVTVRETCPPFLDGRVAHSEQLEAVSVVKDITSDMAVRAKEGSELVKLAGQNQDKTKMKDRFWELQGTAMG